MATNIKDSCPPMKNDPPKSFFTLREVPCTTTYEVVDGWYFPRKIHVTNLHLMCTEVLSVCAAVVFQIKKGTTAVLSCPLTSIQTSVGDLAVGDAFSGTETEVEFLTTDEMTVLVSTVNATTLGKFVAVVEYEQA